MTDTEGTVHLEPAHVEQNRATQREDHQLGKGGGKKKNMGQQCMGAQKTTWYHGEELQRLASGVHADWAEEQQKQLSSIVFLSFLLHTVHCWPCRSSWCASHHVQRGTV